MDRVKQRSITHFGGESLHIIHNDIVDGISTLKDLVGRYGSHPGFMVINRFFKESVWGAHYCWWLFTDAIAIYYRCMGDDQTIYCWAEPSEAQSIEALATCPFHLCDEEEPMAED